MHDPWQVKTEEATSELRWRAGVLQQKWLLRTKTVNEDVSGFIIDLVEEWRDVPSVTDGGG